MRNCSTSKRLLYSTTLSKICSITCESRDPIALPHIGVDLAAYVFELIEIGDRLSIVVDRQAADLLESLGIPEEQGCRSIAHDQPLAVVRDAPALARVGEGAKLLES